MITERIKLLDAVMAVGAGVGTFAGNTQEYAKTFQLVITGAGTVTASAYIEVSNDNVNWIPTKLGTIAVAGTDSATDGFAVNANWAFYRATLSEMTGVGAVATLTMGG